MLMAHPAVLQDLLARYEAAEKEVLAGNATPEAEQRFRDVSYTLCVITGTRDIDAALLAAQYRLPGARVADDSLLSAEDVSAAATGEAAVQELAEELAELQERGAVPHGEQEPASA